MEFKDAVMQRRMVRSYQDTPVPREVLNEALRLAIRAPSAGHTQGLRILVLDDITSREKFWSATTNADSTANTWLTRMRGAPALLIFFSDKDAYLDRYAEPDKGWTDRSEDRWPIPFWHTDAAMSAMKYCARNS